MAARDLTAPERDDLLGALVESAHRDEALAREFGKYIDPTQAQQIADRAKRLRALWDLVARADAITLVEMAHAR